ncbi:MAG: Hpt domain-containing protein, partial [Polaromonas sp.]|nr:Hpt domain-containing protein [Polaromonas sp.]
PQAAAKIEHASFALTEYLEGVLADKPASAVSLFPQYRDIQELVRADRVHPADLWPFEWRWLEPELVVTAEPRNYDDSARAEMDPLMLQLMRGKAPQAAQNLKELSLGFSARQTDRQPRIFWKIAAAYFEAVAHDLLGSDIYVRRAASRILLQYASLAKGDSAISDRLAQDLLFFCAQAGRASDTPILSAVRSSYGLTRFKPVDYELVQFGRFDPALLAQARKRIISAKEIWSSLSAGDVSRFKSVVDQFSLVTDSLLKLHPPSEPLAQALTRAIDSTVRSAQTPRIELAMEVATSVLYLEAAFEDLDPNDPQLSVRTANLAARLEGVRAGGESQPLDGWMEELYRRVSDKQTMGSVVGELRLSLGELENSLDLFFRNPQDKTALQAVPGQLSQMRGVFSVLGLDQASHAVSRMKGSVEQMLVSDSDEARDAGTFEQLGNNLGALSFLIDMLNYQPVLAKKLFVYDEEKGELKPLMGRAQNAASAALAVALNSDLLSLEVIDVVREAGDGELGEHLTGKLDALATHAALAEQPALAQNARDAAVAVSVNNADAAANALTTLAATLVQAPFASASQAASVDFEEDDLRDIFLEEAREVVGNALEAVAALASEPGDVAQLTVLRRAFHTLKGSSRMVGLREFGEAAWALEQLLNSWLADQKTAAIEFRVVCSEVLAGFENWIADIAADQGTPWSASPFRNSADAMRIDGLYSALSLGQVSESVIPSPAMQAVAADAFERSEPQAESEALDNANADLAVSAAVEPTFEFDILVDDEIAAAAALADTPAGQVSTPVINMESIDLDSLFVLPDDRSVSPLLADLAVSDKLQSSSEELEYGEVIEWSAADFDRHFRIEAVTPEQAPAVTVDPSSATELERVAALPESVEPYEVSPSQLEEAAVALNIAVFDDDSDSALTTDNNEDEQIRLIGSLRIGIPLYNVYLNEADEWSRRLVTEVSEWAIESHQLVSDSTVALAHSLAGSSATVGFLALSEIARALEHALQQSRAHHSNGATKYGQLFVDAAEDIRRLLHQFAAGFLKESDADILERLKQLDFSDSVLQPASDFSALDFSAESQPATDDSTKSVGPTEPETVEVELAPAVPARVPVASVPVPAVVVPAAQLTSLDSATFGEEGDEDIDAVDAIDPELFPIFEEECAELMPQLGGALRQWSARPDNLSARMEVLRALHTLKGSARLAGAMRLGEMAHRIESEIEYLGSDAAASQEFEPLLTRFDAMQATFEALRQADAAGAYAPAAPLAIVEPSALDVQEALADGAASSETSARRLAIPAPLGMALQPLRQVASASVRVRSQLLDRMVNQVGEVVITRSRLEAELAQLRGSIGDMNGNLNRLRQQLRDIELQAETQMQSRLAQSKEDQAGFDPLEFDRFTRVQELTRMMAESVNDVATVQRTLQRTVEATEDDLVAQARQTRELQRDLLRTRMVEFEGISERLYRVVRQASKETAKQVRLDLLGATIEMDRGTLDRLTPAFEHLLRNCVVHGIESAQGRTDAGKDPVGHISVHLSQDGNDVSVDFSDDGAGLD